MTARKMGASSLRRLMGGWHARSSREPTYRQIERVLRLLILDGRLPIGIRLPGERHLAAELGVSRTTVAAAYAELREHGFASSRHGSGSITRLPSEPVKFEQDAQDIGSIEFAIAALPAPKEVHAAYVEALAELPRYLPTTGYEPAGLPALRSAIAKRYCDRGVRTLPDEILVTQGAQHGLVLLLGLLASPGTRVIVDQPTYSKALEAIANASCQPVPVALPASGWDLDQLGAAMAQTGASLAYLLPDFHNPTGRCMDELTRARLGRLTADWPGHLIVDETMVDLWLETPPPLPLAAFDRARRVITVGSMGKSFWGGMRVGWVRADREIIAALAVARSANDMGSPVLEQLAAAALLSNAANALDERRKEIKARRDLLLRTVAERLPSWSFETPPGGLSAWAELPLPVGTALAAAAYELGARVAPGGRFGVGGGFERFVRLPYALPEAVLADVVDRLALAWERVTEKPDRKSRHVPADLRLAI